jgi:glycosyltransferase involved in cell wall biosynthesis
MCFVYAYFIPDQQTKAYWSYNEEKVKSFKYNKVLDKNSVTITMCSCRRNDLLKRTIDSILECVTDLQDYLYDWIIIDDNSSKEDREEIKRLYPFITYIEKTPEQKGHCKSMNMFLQLVKTPFMFNLEDDWEFFIHKSYISEMLTVINDKPEYGQCLINANYTEDINTASQIWSCNMHLPKNNNERLYITHLHIPHKFLCDEIHNELNEKIKKGDPIEQYLHSYNEQKYWPHYSLRPGLTRMEVFKNVGNYDDSAPHFEMNFAYRYFEKGYRTAFLFGTTMSHVGRRTFQRNDPNLKNAYDLNKESQFGERIRE